MVARLGPRLLLLQIEKAHIFGTIREGMSSQKPLKQTKLSFSRSDSANSQGSLKRTLSESSDSTHKMSRNSTNPSNYQSGGTSSAESSELSKHMDKFENRQSASFMADDDGNAHRCQDRQDFGPESSNKDNRDESGGFKRQSSTTSEYDNDGNCSEGSHEAGDWDNDATANYYNNLPTTDSQASWGCPFEELPTAPNCFKKDLPKLRDNPPHHYVFFIPTGNLKEAKDQPRPLSGEFYDNWDNDNEVKMPCSKGSRIPDPDDKDRPGMPFKMINRWELIERTLKSKISGSYDLEDAILKYNHRYRNCWNFDALHAYFNEHCNKEEKDTFFTVILLKMTKLALRLPRLFKKSIPFLKQKIDTKLTFSQQQVACLLANAFFCTFPRRNLSTRGGAFPDINFSSMFKGPQTDQKMSKLKCILHYFERVTTNEPKGVITYSRRILREDVDWNNEKTKLSKLHMSPNGTIEDEGKDMLQADFANKYVGGGVLGHGCVQEEIRFLICPEMIVSRLFTQVLLNDDVLVMTGCERFSSYTGYSKTFRWEADYTDEIARDEWGRRYTEVVAMDAISIKRHMNQFEKTHVKRELNKAYCAFKESDRDQPAAVCTGNWGCGAFGGNPELKAVIQIMAASKANRDVCYLSVGNEKLCRDMSKIHTACLEDGIKVGDLFRLIMDYSRKYSSGRGTLLEFIANNCGVSLD